MVHRQGKALQRMMKSMHRRAEWPEVRPVNRSAPRRSGDLARRDTISRFDEPGPRGPAYSSNPVSHSEVRRGRLRVNQCVRFVRDERKFLSRWPLADDGGADAGVRPATKFFLCR